MSNESDKILCAMRAVGFTVRRSAPGIVEFYKDAASAEGLHRMVVYFDKTPLGDSQPFRLSSFAVTTQQVEAPTEEGLELLPSPTRAEFQDVLRALGHMRTRSEWSLDLRTCVSCKSISRSYYVVNKEAVCYECVANRQRK